MNPRRQSDSKNWGESRTEQFLVAGDMSWFGAGRRIQHCCRDFLSRDGSSSASRAVTQERPAEMRYTERDNNKAVTGSGRSDDGGGG